MRLVENESRFIRTKFETLVELSQERSDVGSDDSPENVLDKFKRRSCILRWRRCPEGTEEDKNLADQLSDNYSYNKKLQPLARQLRKNATKSEACLWKYALRAKQLKGYSFRRQRPVMQYIADFFCKELMLIIELDGITHDNGISHTKDIQREERLVHAGFKIVRFTDKEVLNNMAGVISEPERIIRKIETSTPLIPRQRGT